MVILIKPKITETIMVDYTAHRIMQQDFTQYGMMEDSPSGIIV